MTRATRTRRAPHGGCSATAARPAGYSRSCSRLPRPGGRDRPRSAARRYSGCVGSGGGTRRAAGRVRRAQARRSRATRSSRSGRWPAADASSSTTMWCGASRITPQQLRDVAEREGRELIRREAAYRGGRPPLDVTGKTVILVDDGLATGASMFAAVQALREAEPAEIVIAVPAAPESTCREFAGLVDDVVCASHADAVSRGRRVVLGFPPGHRRRGSRAAGHADHRGSRRPAG